MVKKLDRLHEEIEVLETQNKVRRQKCKICGNVGCDVLSFQHKGPVHKACLLSSGNGSSG